MIIFNNNNNDEDDDKLVYLPSAVFIAQVLVGSTIKLHKQI